MAHRALRHRQQGSRPQGNYRSTGLKLEEQLWKNSSHNNNNNSSDNAEALRLDELLVFELHRDGTQRYMHLTVRRLYRYVLSSIADRGTGGTTDPTPSPIPSNPAMPLAVGVQPQPRTLRGDEEEGGGARRVGPAREEPASGAASIPPPPPPPPRGTDAATTPSRHRPRTASMDAAPPPPPHSRAIAATTVAGGAPPPPHKRLGGYLHPRDMRRLVTPFSTSNEPDLIVRRHVMLLNFDPLRAIILRDRLLVLVPDGADSLLEHLERRVRGGSSAAAVENAAFGEDNTMNDDNDDDDGGAPSGHSRKGGKAKKNTVASSSGRELQRSSCGTDSAAIQHSGALSPHEDDWGQSTDEWHDMAAREWINLPFELQCADAVLHVVGSILSDDTYELQTAASDYIHRVLHGDGHGLADDPLSIIRVVKDAVQLMTNRVKGYTQSMNRVLDDDEDMALMNLSRLLTHPERFLQPVTQQVLDEESDEPELILEANLQIGLTLTNYLELVQGQINTAKELIDQRLDATRNRLLFANMMISVFTLCTALASLVGSFYGMNVLPNGFEDQPGAFIRVVGGTIAAAVAVCALIMAVLYQSGTIPRTVRTQRTHLVL